MEEVIKQIRQRLRLTMDGVVATSMREKGVNYKFNFGVTLPYLKQIARDFEKNAELAELLWKKEVRELKILATMLYPPEQFTWEKANEWANEISHIEMAEQFCANLMQEVSFAPTCAAAWIQGNNTSYLPSTGYILYTRLFMKGTPIPIEDKKNFIHTAFCLLSEEYSRAQYQALTALKRYGRQSKEQAEKVLSAFDSFQFSNSSRKQEIYNDLKFEFDYS